MEHANFYFFKFLSSASSLTKKFLVPGCRPFNLLQDRPKTKAFHWQAIPEKIVFRFHKPITHMVVNMKLIRIQ